MTDNVIISGLKGVPDWATEETLTEIRDLAKTGVQLDKVANVRGGKKKKEADQRIKGLGKQFENAVEKQKGILSKVFSGSLTRIVKGTIVGGASLDTVFKKMAQHGIDLLGNIPIIGTALVAITGIMLKLVDVARLAIDQFLELYNTGITLNGSFINLMHVSATAGLSIMEMTDALKSHSETIVRLSTENNQGAFAFAELSRSVVDNMMKFNLMGLRLGEVNDYFLDYLDIQRMAGSVQQMNTQRTTDHFTEYMRQLSLLSRVTGIQRKQLQEQINEALRDDSFNAKLAGLGEEARAQVINNLAAATMGGPAMVSAFKDIFVFGTAGITESSKSMVIGMNDVVQHMTKMNELALQGIASDPFEFLRIFKRSAKEFTDTMGPMAAQLGALGNPILEGAATAAAIGRQIDIDRAKVQARLDDALAAFTLKWDVLTGKMSGQFLKTAAKILESLEESGLFQTFVDTVENVMKALIKFLEQDWQPFIDKLGPGIKTFGEWIASVLGAINPEELAKDDPNDTRSPLTKITDMLNSMVDGILARFEWGIDRIVNKLTFGAGGTSKPYAEYQEYLKEEAIKRVEDRKAREKQDEKDARLENFITYAKGGIARVPSVFGEAGPEVAIPLPDGSRIPVAEVKRPAAEMKTFEDIRSLLEDIKDRVEFQASELKTQTGIQRQIERKTGNDSLRIF